jgi:hypothetical protein
MLDVGPNSSVMALKGRDWDLRPEFEVIHNSSFSFHFLE